MSTIHPCRILGMASLAGSKFHPKSIYARPSAAAFMVLERHGSTRISALMQIGLLLAVATGHAVL